MNFSRPALALATLTTIIGLLSGVAWYLDRSDELERHVDGTSAWIPHAVVTVVVAVWWVIAARRSPLGAKVVFSPLLRPITSRIAATFRARSPLSWIAVVLLVFLELYMCWRIGEQVFAGLDPNFVANAWGGPSYLGAMFCHYIDAALMLAVFHTLLRWVTVPSRAASPVLR
jgi:hypothetical protein